MGIFKAPNFTTRAEKISSFTVSTAEYGSCVMELLGTTRISGNVLYYDDFTAHEHRERIAVVKAVVAKLQPSPILTQLLLS